MKWEYRVLKMDTTGFWGRTVDDESLEQRMNDLGQQGWEMTRVVPLEQNETTSAIVVFFKRQVS
jgi:hypothetical protein